MGSGRPPPAVSAGRTALGRRIQRRHLPAARPPVPADVRWPRDRGTRPAPARRKPTRSGGQRATGRNPRMRCPPGSIDGVRPGRANARSPGSGVTPDVEAAAAVLTDVSCRCIRSTARSDADSEGSGFHEGRRRPFRTSKIPPGDRRVNPPCGDDHQRRSPRQTALVQLGDLAQRAGWLAASRGSAGAGGPDRDAVREARGRPQIRPVPMGGGAHPRGEATGVRPLSQTPNELEISNTKSGGSLPL